MLKGKKFDASALPRPRYACTPTEVRMRSDRNATIFKYFLHHFWALKVLKEWAFRAFLYKN